MSKLDNPIYGLVLVGGESRRMGCDKALLSYEDGVTQLERTSGLLHSVCSRVYVSQRRDQVFCVPEGTQTIYDSVGSIAGPLCGILSALRAYPEAHWLTLACDLPYLTPATLESLISTFCDRSPQLTAYRSSQDGLPEPLCAIYPSGCGGELLALAEGLGTNSPRKLLIERKARLIDLDDLNSLDNINTPEAYKAIVKQ